VRGQVIDGSVAGKLSALEEHLQAAYEERRLFPLEPSITESTED